MKFPNAARGVKKLFIAEILALIGGISTFVAAVFFLITLTSGGVTVDALTAEGADVEATLNGITGGTIGGFLGTFISGLIAIVVTFVAFILRIVGVVQSKKDDENFGVALVFIIISVVCYILSSAVFNFSSVVSSFANTVTDLMNVLATVFIVSGIIRLSDKLNNGEVAKKGVNILKLIVLINAFSLIGNLIVSFMGGINVSSSIASAVIAIVISVLTVVEYILYLSFLSKAKKMLATS